MNVTAEAPEDQPGPADGRHLAVRRASAFAVLALRPPLSSHERRSSRRSRRRAADEERHVQVRLLVLQDLHRPRPYRRATTRRDSESRSGSAGTSAPAAAACAPPLRPAAGSPRPTRRRVRYCSISQASEPSASADAEHVRPQIRAVELNGFDEQARRAAARRPMPPAMRRGCATAGCRAPVPRRSRSRAPARSLRASLPRVGPRASAGTSLTEAFWLNCSART